MSEAKEDYSAYMPSPEAIQTAHLFDTIDSLQAAQVEAAEAQKVADLAKAKVTNLETKILPEIMRELHLTEARNEHGIKVELSNKLRASLAADKNPKRAQALDWLEANGHGDMITNEVVVTFPKELAPVAEKLIAALPKWGGWKPGMEISRRRDVATNSVIALLNELRNEDPPRPVPLELFQGFEDIKVKIVK